MGEPKEKVRAMMIEVSVWFFGVSCGLLLRSATENDTACGQASGSKLCCSEILLEILD